MPVLSDARTIPSKFSMPASYFRAPRTVKIEWGGRALPLHISIFGRSGIPSKMESKTINFEVRARNGKSGPMKFVPYVHLKIFIFDN